MHLLLKTFSSSKHSNCLSNSSGNKKNKCDALHNLVPFVQFKTREKHPCRCVTFSKAAGFSLQLKEKDHSS